MSRVMSNDERDTSHSFAAESSQLSMQTRVICSIRVPIFHHSLLTLHYLFSVGSIRVPNLRD